MITVITPTYNRAHLLNQLYDSLLSQTAVNLIYQWIVVDDGSTDDTRSVVNRLADHKKLNIVYKYQDNAGKHVAVNRGMQSCVSEFVIILDSDDMLASTAVFDFYSAWDLLEGRDSFYAVIGLTADQDSKDIIGDRYPSDGMVVIAPLGRSVKGDKCSMMRTDIIKQFPFPVFEGEKFIAESVLWDEIIKDYHVFCFNKVVAYKKYLAGGLSDQSVKLRRSSPKGTLFLYGRLARNTHAPIMLRLRAIINYLRFWALSCIDRYRRRRP